MFTHRRGRCCICSANYCKFRLITLLVWLVDVIALFFVMRPLSWYQFCVLLPLEVRTVGLVLFLQVLALLSVLHCLPPAGHVEPVFSVSVFSVASCASQNSELQNTEKKVFATCAAPVPCYTRHDLLSLETAAMLPLPLPPADRTYITSRHCEKRAQKATPIEKRREELTEEDQSDRRFS